MKTWNPPWIWVLTYWDTTDFLPIDLSINKSSLIFLAQNTYNYWGDSLFLVGNKIHKLYCWKIEEKWATQEFLILPVVGITQLFFSFSSDLETAWLICFSAVVSWPVSRKISSQVFFYIRWNANSFYTFGGHPFWTFVLEFKRKLVAVTKTCTLKPWYSE